MRRDLNYIKGADFLRVEHRDVRRQKTVKDYLVSHFPLRKRKKQPLFFPQDLGLR